jgi:hypothetical protein
MGFTQVQVGGQYSRGDNESADLLMEYSKLGRPNPTYILHIYVLIGLTFEF